MKTPQKSRALKTPKSAEDRKGETSLGDVASKWREALGAVKPLASGLYVTATPIGNLRDITLRALDVLTGADLILCEDTRVTGKLLRAYGIKAELLAYHDHSAPGVRSKILAHLAEGARVALVSDAGTPLISDPGYRLVVEAREAGHDIFAVPGANSVAAAVSIAGLPSDRFLFAGFLPPKQGARRKALEELKSVRASLVLLEGPSRLGALLEDASEVLGKRQAAVARELTKLYEEVRRETLPQLAAHYRENGPPKGEIVLVIAPPTDDEGAAIDIDAALRAALKIGSVKSAASEVAEITGRPRRELYARALEILDQHSKED